MIDWVANQNTWFTKISIYSFDSDGFNTSRAWAYPLEMVDISIFQIFFKSLLSLFFRITKGFFSYS